MLLKDGQIECNFWRRYPDLRFCWQGRPWRTRDYSLPHLRPFTDAPNHLARAAIMGSLLFDAHSPYHGMFAVSHTFMPYMLPDLGMVLAIRVLGFNVACPVWSTLTMIVLVFAVWFMRGKY